tara:strand:- start:360 stop:2006 length:1647 start_codon:yes stop_codon:yes gene_type:complete
MDEQNKLERRMVAESPELEVRKDANGRTVIQGYAALYHRDNSPVESQDLGGFVERIMPGAFDEVLSKNPDVFGRYNHDRLLGRTSAGTVRLFLDDRGLRYEIDPKPADADIVQSLERKDIKGSSFAFRSSSKNESWQKDEEGRMIREIRSFDFLGDVGPVDEPAYPSTEAFVSQRALEMAKLESRRVDSDPVLPDPDDDEYDVEDPLAEDDNVVEFEVEIQADDSSEDKAEDKEPPEDEEPPKVDIWAKRAGEEVVETREVNLKPTQKMANAAKRGLRLHKDGKSGDGLKPETVSRANKLARRENMNRDWVVEMNAWFKRHASDKKEGWMDAGSETPGAVAWLLWGASPKWAERKVAELERAGERSAASTPAPKKDQIKGSGKNKEGSAKNASGKIKVSEKVRSAIKKKVQDHNAAMKKAKKPSWTKATSGQLLAVYRRGAGAYSTSHRPNVSRGAWAMARVNAYLYLLRNGSPKNAKYKTDNDLLPSAHPKSSKERSVSAGDDCCKETPCDDKCGGGRHEERSEDTLDIHAKIAGLKATILNTKLQD